MANLNLKQASCKLCLEPLLDTKFKVIGDLTKGIMDILLMKMKFEEGSKDLICSYCYEKLNGALEFKSVCLNTDNTIIPYMNSEKMLQLDLREIYMMEKKSEQLTDISEDVCRLCMQLVGSDFRYIHEEEVAIIQKLIPGMNINIIKDPIVCNQCFGSLSIHNRFLKKCFEVDEKIGNICDNLATDNQTDDELPLDLLIKTESLDEEWEINENEMSLKVEPIDIKSERYEDESISNNELHLAIETIEEVLLPNKSLEKPGMSSVTIKRKTTSDDDLENPSQLSFGGHNTKLARKNLRSPSPISSTSSTSSATVEENECLSIINEELQRRDAEATRREEFRQRANREFVVHRKKIKKADELIARIKGERKFLRERKEAIREQIRVLDQRELLLDIRERSAIEMKKRYEAILMKFNEIID